MAKIIIEIEDLPDGKVSYVPRGDLLIRDGGTHLGSRAKPYL